MPTDTPKDAQVEDVYKQVLNCIEKNELAQTVGLVQQLNPAGQLDIIHKLAMVLARERELAGALALSFDLVLARDLISELTEDDALTLDRNLDLTLTLTLTLADALGDTLAHDLAGALADSQARDRDLNMMNVIRAVIAGLLGITTLHLVPIPVFDTVADAITADTLEAHIVPYIKALTDVQRVMAEIKQRDFANPTILKIEAEAYTIKWRNLYAEVNAMLKKIEVWRNANEDLLVDALNLMQSSASSSEEAQASKRSLDQQTDDLIKLLVQEFAPDSVGEQRASYLERLKVPITVLAQHTYGPEMAEL